MAIPAEISGQGFSLPIVLFVRAPLHGDTKSSIVVDLAIAVQMRHCCRCSEI